MVLPEFLTDLNNIIRFAKTKNMKGYGYGLATICLMLLFFGCNQNPSLHSGSTGRCSIEDKNCSFENR